MTATARRLRILLLDEGHAWQDLHDSLIGLGIIIQRNGSYYNLAVQGKNGWEHADCRSTDWVGSYDITLAQAQDEAEAWFKELTTEDEEEAA